MAEPASGARLTNPRLYRLSFLPALVALVALMFSLEGIPAPIEPVSLTGAFQSEEAGQLTREIARLAPERPAGSEGDERVAGLVEERFNEIPTGVVTEQELEADVDGDTVDTRNVIITLPGDADRSIVVLANRDSESGPGVASSAAATAVLVELAEALGVSGHESTYVLASTAAGPAGATALVDSLRDLEAIEAVIVISQPAAAEPRTPHVIASSSGVPRASVQLRRTAERALETQTARTSAGEGTFRQLARLAIPSGLGEQAPLIADRVDAITLSSAGERALAPGEDGIEQFSGRTLDEFGRTIHSLVGAIDLVPDLEHGPPVYIEIADSLLPGWTLAVLGLALLLPAGVAAVDGSARAARRGGEIPSALGWAAARGLPFVGGLAALYGLATLGAIPRPEFPFDPGLYPVGARAVVMLVLIAIAIAASAVLVRALKVTGRHAPLGVVPAIGVLATLAGVVLWIANPYLALLAVPAAHVWLLADGPREPRRTAIVALAAPLATIPVIAAFASVSGALELGSDAPWTFTLMIADGQIGIVALVGLSFVAATLLGAVAVAIGGGGGLPATPNERRPRRITPDQGSSL
jgi:hypothetical protein